MERKRRLDDIDKRISDEMKKKYPIMRLVISGKATLNELRTVYDIEDMVFLNSCLDIQQEVDNA